MKKLMVILAAVVMAGAAHAATMSWSITNMQAMDVEVGWMVALYDSSAAFDYDAALAGTQVALYTTTAAANGTTVRVSSTGNNKPDGNAYAAGDSISAYAVVFNAASIADATQVIISEVRSATVNAQGSNISLAFGSMAATTTANKFLNSSWQAVPEPTSGLLRLVGLGALALRRRRA